MDTARFLTDLERAPETLAALGPVLEEGADLAELPEMGNRPRVLILGMGSSFFAADMIAREARAQGLCVTAELASAETLPEPSDDLLVIAVSATGESAEVCHTVRRYAGRARGVGPARGRARLVAVTNSAGSTLASLADVTVPLRAGEEVSGVACRTFRHAVVVLRAVLARYGMVSPLGPAELCARGAAAVAHLLERRSSWLVDAAAALSSPQGTWVLAPVERLASGRQAALMMREVPRRLAVACETGDWSHIDVYLTKVLDYRALLFAGSRWDVAALEWMRERGSTLVSVGAHPELGEHAQAVCTIRYPDDGVTAVAQLADVTVGELLAAHWHG